MRLLVLIKDNDVPRLKQLIDVAFRAKRSINYVVDMVVKATEGIYLAHPDQDDKELAFLIWQIGGPALLDICAKAIGLSNKSTAYRMV